jgi:hypothetical protein
MTDKEAMKLALEALELLTGAWQTFGALDYGDNAIAALKERLAQPEQEPVAVVDVHEFYDNCANFSLLQKLPKGKHTLYTTPPQRTEQEPPPWWFAVENILNEYGLQAIDFVADFKAAIKDAEQPQRTEQNFCSRCGKRTNDIHTCTPPQEKT